MAYWYLFWLFMDVACIIVNAPTILDLLAGGDVYFISYYYNESQYTEYNKSLAIINKTTWVSKLWSQ